MSTLPPSDLPAVFWIDGAGQQQGPEPLATVIERIAFDQIPPTTPVWWQGSANWTAFNENSELANALKSRLTPQSSAPVSEPVTTEPATPTFDAETTIEASPFASPQTFEAPRVFETAVVADPFEPAPTPEVTLPAQFSSEPIITDLHADDHPPLSMTQPKPEPEPAAPRPLRLGEQSELLSTFAAMTVRTADFAAEHARAAALDDTLAATVRQALLDIGFKIEESMTSGEYHSYRLASPDGQPASLAIERVPSAPTVAKALERPLSCFVDYRGRASVGLFVEDYLRDGSSDQALFTKHLAAIVNAASNAG